MTEQTARSLRLADREVGAESPALIIAEVAQTHDGSLGLAHAFVDAVADAGADAIKFQTHIASAESTPSEPFRVPFSPADDTRYDYWRRIEFSEDEWRGLADHARSRDLIFLSSPFSIEAVELLESVGVPAWKLGSGEISNTPLIRRVAATGLPVIISSGLSGWSELDSAVDLLRGAKAPFAVLQCASRYPCPPEEIGLNALADLRDRYSCPVGLSDHSGTIYPGIVAVALDASIMELHVTLSRQMFGPDVPASVTTAELKQLVAGVRMIERALANPVDKDAAAEELAPLREVFARSAVPHRDLSAGTVITEEDLALKKPGGGVPPERMQEIVGRRLRRDVRADQPIAEGDLE